MYQHVHADKLPMGLSAEIDRSGAQTLDAAFWFVWIVNMQYVRAHRAKKGGFGVAIDCFDFETNGEVTIKTDDPESCGNLAPCLEPAVIPKLP